MYSGNECYVLIPMHTLLRPLAFLGLVAADVRRRTFRPFPAQKSLLHRRLRFSKDALSKKEEGPLGRGPEGRSGVCFSKRLMHRNASGHVGYLLRGHLVPGGHDVIAVDWNIPEHLIVVEIKMPVHLHRLGNARAHEINDVISAAVHGQISIRGIDRPCEVAVATDAEG